MVELYHESLIYPGTTRIFSYQYNKIREQRQYGKFLTTSDPIGNLGPTSMLLYWS